MLELGLLKIIWRFFPISNPAGQSSLILNLTCHEMCIKFIIFNNPYMQPFTRKYTRSEVLAKYLRNNIFQRKLSIIHDYFRISWVTIYKRSLHLQLIRPNTAEAPHWKISTILFGYVRLSKDLLVDPHHWYGPAELDLSKRRVETLF